MLSRRMRGVPRCAKPTMRADTTCDCDTPAAGTNYEVVYFKWLDFELVGIERTKLPLPSTFPLHQWAMTYMGEPPHPSQHWYAEESYGIVSAASVMNWEPIVYIGTRVWRPTAKFCAANA